MRILIYLCLYLFANVANATDQIRIYDVNNMAVNAITNLTFKLNSDSPSGDATSESAPAKIYVPMEITASGNRGYFYLNTGSVATPYELFGYTSDTAGGDYTTFNSYSISYPLVQTIGSTAKYIYVAVKLASSSSYKAIARTSSAVSDVTSQAINFNFTPQKICETVVSETSSCSNFDLNGTVTEATKSYTLYFFLSDSSTLINSIISTSTYTGGVYFLVNFSNRTYTYSELNVSLTNMRRGDSRVTASFTNSVTMEDFKKSLAFLHSGTTCSSYSSSTSTNSKVNDCAGSFYSDQISSSQASSFTLPNLTNGTPVTISVALIDKYGFASTLSNSGTATPTDIEELLKKQNCFLLTAGFGEEHFVIDYFRNFRDTFLIKNYLGQMFIKNYYKYAPSFALSIYNNQSIRFVIRSFAYVGYYLMNYFAWFLVVFYFAFFSFYIFKQKKSHQI